jgi:hypothetical protein
MYNAPEASSGFRFPGAGSARHRDWGTGLSWFSPVVAHREGAHIIIGGGPVWTEYGFRSVPYRTRIAVQALLATGTVGLETTGQVGLGIQATAERRFSGSPAYVRLFFRATPFEAFRFYGYGNNSPNLDPDTALVARQEMVIEALLGTEGEEWTIQFGPRIHYSNPDVPAGNPALGLPGGDIVTSLGAVVRAEYDRVGGTPYAPAGFAADLRASLYPDPEGGSGLFAQTDGEVRGYLPIPGPNRPTLAVRLGVRRSWGDFPVHMADAVGGRFTLRGYREHRFAGDEAVYGGVELRLPLTRANLILARGRIGVLGLADVGRVRVDGQSPGGWHTGLGAGVFFQTLDTTVYASWAYGDEHRFYATLGMPF